MKHSLLLALWSTGVLGGPCKPSKPSETSIAYGTPTESNHISLGLSSTDLDSTKTGQDGAHETSTGTAPGGSQISVSIPFSESDLNSHTQGSGSNTIGLPEGSATGTGSLPNPTSGDVNVPGTSTGDADAEETSEGAGNSGSPSSPQTDGTSPTGTSGLPEEHSGTATNPEASGTATSPDDSGNPTGTAPGMPEGSSGTLINTDVSGQPTGTATGPGGEPGNTEVNTGTDVPTTVPGGASGTATNPEGSGPSGTATVPGEPGTTNIPTGISEGVSGTATVPGQPGNTEASSETDIPTGISQGVSDGPSGTATVPGEPGTTDATIPGDASGTASFSGSDSNPTEAATGETSNGGPAASHDSTNTSGSPEETISASGNPATGTEPGQDTATQTGAPGTDVVPTGSETSVAGPDQPSTTAPGNTIPDGQATLSHSNGEESMTSGDVTGDQSATVPTGAAGVTTTAPGNADQTTGSPDQSTGVSSDQNTDGNTNETSRGPENSSAVSTTDAGAAQPTTNGDGVTTKPVPDNTDASSAGSSEANNGATTTGAGAVVTTDSGVIPSTTMPGPSATANPITTAATTGTDMPVVTEAPPGFNPTTVSDHPEWTTNTWITTTSEGSSDPTIVPVLVGCKKCGGSGSGIILWGFPHVTGTWFQLPGLPKFSFPCIPPASGCTSPPTTSESGEDGDDDDDDDKSSSTTCTDKVTVTDCFVACTTYTGPAGETVTPECQTTCTATHTGCSVTGTTTTSSAAACGPSGDSECKTCKVDLTANDDSESLKRRSLERRGGVDIKKNIAGCDWSSSAVGAPRFPAYPGGNLVLNNEAAITAQNSPLDQIKRWWRTTRDTDCVPHLNHIGEAQYPKSGLTDVEGPSIDHVYEKSMLLDFWRFIIDPAAPAVVGMKTGTPAKINCDDIKSYGGINSGTNLIQKVFDTYPGSAEVLMPNNAQFMDDFIGMDQWTNGNAKAQITDPQGTKAQADKKTTNGKAVKANTNIANAKRWIEDKLLFLEALAIGVEMFNVQEAKDALIRQNLRIYQTLVDMDENAKNCMKDDAVINNVWSFADKYKTFMADRFTGNQDYSMNQGVDYAKNKLLTALTTDVANAAKIKNIPAGDLSSWQKRLANMQDASRAWGVSVTFVWAGPTTRKRDTDGLSCDRPNPSLTTESTTEPTESTTFATSVRVTSSDQTTTSKEEVPSTTKQPSSTNPPPPLTDLPSLTQQIPDSTISTPDGSSCAETATATNCNLGVGGGHPGAGCIERPFCNSWVNTKTTSTTPTPTPTLAKPDPGRNEKHCYNSGQQSNYDAITYAAESFCRDVVNDKIQGPVWSNYKLEGKKVPSTGYHFKLAFQVYEGCVWTANYDECMRYMKVPIDSCNCSAKGNKQGGWVENNCIMARIDPNSGI
ncbi:hypothetical protein F53441_281 [Fusarium austroafricanum]|uniref:Uncharacterized protein n=1 Tax=Fusarium austroafricanum TaxID=2364996 RepID=A0A8H4KY24_9HYPO|nr:hypothetical protein F53441_281 [Fusarium austroafricanum]